MVAACMFGVSTGPAAFILGAIGLFVNGFEHEFGWRGGYVLLSLILLCITLPVVLFILKDHPADIGLQVDGRTDNFNQDAETKLDEIGYTFSA